MPSHSCGSLRARGRPGVPSYKNDRVFVFCLAVIVTDPTSVGPVSRRGALKPGSRCHRRKWAPFRAVAAARCIARAGRSCPVRGGLHWPSWPSSSSVATPSVSGNVSVAVLRLTLLRAQFAARPPRRPASEHSLRLSSVNSRKLLGTSRWRPAPPSEETVPWLSIFSLGHAPRLTEWLHDGGDPAGTWLHELGDWQTEYATPTPTKALAPPGCKAPAARRVGSRPRIRTPPTHFPQQLDAAPSWPRGGQSARSGRWRFGLLSSMRQLIALHATYWCGVGCLRLSP